MASKSKKTNDLPKINLPKFTQLELDFTDQVGRFTILWRRIEKIGKTPDGKDNFHETKWRSVKSVVDERKILEWHYLSEAKHYVDTILLRQFSINDNIFNGATRYNEEEKCIEFYYVMSARKDSRNILYKIKISKK